MKKRIFALLMMLVLILISTLLLRKVNPDTEGGAA